MLSYARIYIYAISIFGQLSSVWPQQATTPGPPDLYVDQVHPYEGNYVTFSCRTGSINLSSVEWYKDGTYLRDWSSVSWAKKVTLEDSGMYKCAFRTINLFSGFSNNVYLNISKIIISDAATDYRLPWWAAVAIGGALGCLAFVVIVIIGVTCCRNRRKKPASRRDPLCTNAANKDSNKKMTRNAYDNVSVTASNVYLEIAEPGYLEDKKKKNMSGHVETDAIYNQYEELEYGPTKFDYWIKEHNISQSTQRKLHTYGITTMEDLKILKKKAILELHLNINDHISLMAALKELKKAI